MLKYFNGIPVLVENTISKESKEEAFYISYNPSHRDYGVDTTALVITIGNNERQVYYVLKGNHSKPYEECTTLAECLSYYTEHESEIHSFSDAFEHGTLVVGQTETTDHPKKNAGEWSV